MSIYTHTQTHTHCHSHSRTSRRSHRTQPPQFLHTRDMPLTQSPYIRPTRTRLNTLIPFHFHKTQQPTEQNFGFNGGSNSSNSSRSMDDTLMRNERSSANAKIVYSMVLYIYVRNMQPLLLPASHIRATRTSTIYAIDARQYINRHSSHSPPDRCGTQHS